MMSMDKATPTDRSKEITAIDSTIGVHYKQFKEIHTINKRINNVELGVFQECKKSEDE